MYQKSKTNLKNYKDSFIQALEETWVLILEEDNNKLHLLILRSIPFHPNFLYLYFLSNRLAYLSISYANILKKKGVMLLKD